MNPKSNNKSHYVVSMRERGRELVTHGRRRERKRLIIEMSRRELYKARERERESHRRLAEQVSEFKSFPPFLHKEERILLYKTKATYKLT